MKRKPNKPQIKCDSLKFKVRLQTLSRECISESKLHEYQAPGESSNKLKCLGRKLGQGRHHNNIFIYLFIVIYKHGLLIFVMERINSLLRAYLKLFSFQVSFFKLIN